MRTTKHQPNRPRSATASRWFGNGRAAAIAALLLAATLSGCIPAATPPEPTRAELLPPPDAPRLDQTMALSLAALPLACVDRPHPAPRGPGYLYERSAILRPDFEATRAFYGCYDWHSAVNSTWSLTALLRRFPDLPIGPLIVEKLQQHLSASAMLGEEEFFAADGTGGFERPYGWAWFLALHAELRQLDLPESVAWAEATAPLASRFAAGLADYFERIAYPIRVGTHANTAFALDLAIQYARTVEAVTLEDSLTARAVELFGSDEGCGLAFEPSGSDFFSPCLEEAKLMSVVLPAAELATWLDGFLPSVDSPALQRIAEPIALGAEGDADLALDGARSHLIGLAFTRAEALARIARALPAQDPRIGEMDRLAAAAAANGLAAMFDADYLGSHWLATFALRYLVSTAAGPPVGPGVN